MITFMHLIRGVCRAVFSAIVRRQAGAVGSGLKVNKFSWVTEQTILGKNVNFNGLIIRSHGNVKIGDNFHCGTDCEFITSVHNYDHGKAIPYDNTYIFKDINIGDNVWLGNRVTILGGVNIGEGAIIQAGSVVVNDIPPCAIAGGHPARVFKERDKEHYFSLKDEGKFN